MQFFAVGVDGSEVEKLSAVIGAFAFHELHTVGFAGEGYAPVWGIFGGFEDGFPLRAVLGNGDAQRDLAWSILSTAGIDDDEAREVAEFAEADYAAGLDLTIGVKGSAHGLKYAPVRFGSIPAAGGAEFEQSAGTEQIAGEGFDGDG